MELNFNLNWLGYLNLEEAANNKDWFFKGIYIHFVRIRKEYIPIYVGSAIGNEGISERQSNYFEAFKSSSNTSYNTLDYEKLDNIENINLFDILNDPIGSNKNGLFFQPFHKVDFTLRFQNIHRTFVLCSKISLPQEENSFQSKDPFVFLDSNELTNCVEDKVIKKIEFALQYKIAFQNKLYNYRNGANFIGLNSRSGSISDSDKINIHNCLKDLKGNDEVIQNISNKFNPFLSFKIDSKISIGALSKKRLINS